MLLSGDVVVVTEDGREVTAERRTVAVCRCGRSARAPWCDGSHKLLTRPADRSPRPGRDGTST